jgi:hypothetical protein
MTAFARALWCRCGATGLRPVSVRAGAEARRCAARDQGLAALRTFPPPKPALPREANSGAHVVRCRRVCGHAPGGIDTG